MTLNTDRLLEIFERHLGAGNWKTISEEEFIFKIVEDYVIELIRVGHIPLHYLESIREDLEAEVLEMFRMKTYGQNKKIAR